MGITYNINFDPVLLPGETATLKGSEFPNEGLPVICQAYLALPEYVKDFGALVAATWLDDQEDTNLELGLSEFSQMRIEVQDDIQVKIKNPPAVELWRSATTPFYLKQLPTEPGQDWLKQLLWRMSEFYIYERDTPRFCLYCSVAAVKSRLLFRGWKFKVAEIKVNELTSKQVIRLNSWPASK